MSTILGDYLRKLRIGEGEILKDMAEKLKVSSAFLSAVENGKKNMPDSWYSILQKEYKLTPDEMDSLKQAAMESQKSLILDLSNSTLSNRQLAVSFARQFEDMDENTGLQILNILKKRKEGKAK